MIRLEGLKRQNVRSLTGDVGLEGLNTLPNTPFRSYIRSIHVVNATPFYVREVSGHSRLVEGLVKDLVEEL